MKNKNIIAEISKLNLCIGKMMFTLSKVQDVKKQPSPLQFKVLDYLLQNKNTDICQRDLEKSLKVSKATISEVLLTMEKNGIIKRVASLNDARSKNIVVTDSSLKRYNELKKIEKEMNHKLTKNISEEELNIFLTIMNKMKENLNED